MKIIIVGNGISGISAARWIRKQSDYEIHVISSETKYFFSRTALMYVYMGHLRFKDTQPYEDWFWKKNNINLIHDHVESIDYSTKKVLLRSGNSESYDKLILALGSKSNKFGWPGQDLNGVGGLYHFQDLENMERYSNKLQRAVIVGGGLIGIEMAEMFHSRKIPVTMLVRESEYWNNVLPAEESTMISRHIQKHNIDLRLSSNLGEIIDDGTGTAAGIIIKETGERIDCGYVGLTAGVSPNVEFLKNDALDVDRGVLVDDYLNTNIDDVYAVGDCVQLKNPVSGRRAIEAVWYTGRMMGETVAYTICGSPTKYDPGIWFNSAKFIDIEYQVYGTVLNIPADNHGSFYWEHPNGEQSIRLVFEKESKAIIGFNLMGIRFRHEVCEKWIKKGTHIEEVIENLALADFNPEFCATYEEEIIDSYNREYGTQLIVKNNKTLNAVGHFLKN